MAGEQETKYCTDCGQSMAADARFCNRCGAEQQPAEPTTTTDAEHHQYHHATDQSESRAKWKTFLLYGAAAVGGIVILLVLVGFFLGVVSDPSPELNGDAWSNEEKTDTMTGQRLEADVTLEEGQFAARHLNPQIPVEYHVEIDANREVEVFVTDRDNLGDIRDGDSVTTYSTFSESGQQFTISGELGAGDYVLVIDNSEYGDSSPSGDVTGEVVIEGSL